MAHAHYWFIDVVLVLKNLDMSENYETKQAHKHTWINNLPETTCALEPTNGVFTPVRISAVFAFFFFASQMALVNVVAESPILAQNKSLITFTFKSTSCVEASMLTTVKIPMGTFINIGAYAIG